MTSIVLCWIMNLETPASSLGKGCKQIKLSSPQYYYINAKQLCYLQYIDLLESVCNFNILLLYMMQVNEYQST